MQLLVEVVQALPGVGQLLQQGLVLRAVAVRLQPELAVVVQTCPRGGRGGGGQRPKAGVETGAGHIKSMYTVSPSADPISVSV